MSIVSHDEPLPFALHTGILQLVGLACATPSDIGEVSVKIDRIISTSVNVRVYPGGYEAGKDKVFDETITLSHQSEADAVKQLADLIDKVNATLANGRQVKIAALKDKATAMLKLAEQLEAAASRQLATG